mmetsp:Transcript_22626/g.37376  ORF Transcript_22626/g.37376 Transcript_22626/m.37376 type:complete len:211 (+) Transcript_22626:1388-2020(+)
MSCVAGSLAIISRNRERAAATESFHCIGSSYNLRTPATKASAVSAIMAGATAGLFDVFEGFPSSSGAAAAEETTMGIPNSSARRSFVLIPVVARMGVMKILHDNASLSRDSALKKPSSSMPFMASLPEYGVPHAQPQCAIWFGECESHRCTPLALVVAPGGRPTKRNRRSGSALRSFGQQWSRNHSIPWWLVAVCPLPRKPMCFVCPYCR